MSVDIDATVTCSGCSKRVPALALNGQYTFPRDWVDFRVANHQDVVCSLDCVLIAVSEAVSQGKVTPGH